MLAYQALAGGGGWACDGALLTWRGRVSRTDLVANVVAFVPLGLLVALLGTGSEPTRRSSRARVLVGLVSIAGFSLALEALQACLPARISSLQDSLANVAGALAGLCVAVGLRRIRGTTAAGALTVVLRESRVDLLPLAVPVMWILSQTAPWLFSVDVGRWRANLSFLKVLVQEGPPIDGWQMARHLAAWIAIGAACRLAVPGRLAAVATLGGAVAVALTLQVALEARRPLSTAELSGIALAVVLLGPALLFCRGSQRSRAWPLLLATAALAAVAAYELEPGVGTTRSFSPWPLVGLGGLGGAMDYALLFGWCGLTTAVAARAAGADSGRRAWPWLAGVLIVVLALELIQTTIPGRGPDSSAPLFVLLGWLTARAIQSSVQSSGFRMQGSSGRPGGGGDPAL